MWKIALKFITNTLRIGFERCPNINLLFSESIMSHVTRHNGSALDYDKLRKNWNHWVSTGEELEPREQILKEGKW